MSEVGVGGVATSSAPTTTIRGWAAKAEGRSGVLIVTVAVAVLFAPFLFLGRHAVAFHYEPASWTGLAGGASAPRLSVTRRYDVSPLCIHYPNEAFVAEAFRHGELPVWNPYAGMGTAGLGGGQVYPFSPYFWPFYLFPNPWVYTAGLLLACLWGGVGITFWLARFGFPGWARGFAAAAWTLSPWVSHFFTYSDVWAGAWFGWLLWAWDRFVLDEGVWWLPAPFIAGMVYCGHPEVALVMAGASGLYALVGWGTSDPNRRIALSSLAGGAMGAAALTVALTAVHWLPVLLRATESLPYKFMASQELLRSASDGGDLLSPLSATYLSPSILGLALLGLAWLGRSRMVWLALLLPVLSLGGLLQPVFLGPVNSMLTLGGLIPGFYYRSLLWFGLAPILAAAAVVLVGGEKAARPWRTAIFAFPVILYVAFFMVSALKPGGVWILCQGIALAALAGALLTPPCLRRRALATAALCLVCLDPFVLLTGCLSEHSPYAFRRGLRACCGRFTRIDPSHQDPSSWGAVKDLLEETHGRMWAGSGEAFAGGPFLAPNLATLWSVRDLRIQDVLLGRRLALLHQTVQGPGRHPYFASLYFSRTSMQDLALMGVSQVGRPLDRDSGRFFWEKVSEALPRAFLVHEVRPAASEEESVRLWREGLIDRAWFKKGAIIEGWTGPPRVGEARTSDAVTWLEDGLARLRLRATVETGGMVVLLDAVADGWESRVDGRPVPLYPANLAFRAVAVPPGTHEITFSYGAPGLARGIFLAGIGWTAVIGLALSARKRVGGDHRRAPGGAA